MTAPFPHHPRLAEHVLARRHVVDGQEQVVLHDSRSGNLIRMEPRIWAILASADGTRTIEGLILAAAQQGALLRMSEVRAVLDPLHAEGLLAGGIEPRVAPVPRPDRPLDLLPDFSLTCDGAGACCTQYGSITFTPLEAARARVLLPEIQHGGEEPERAFLPERGVSGRGNLAVTLVDNRCAYLGEGGGCQIHAIGGASAKPDGCRVYPATFVDDGEVVRVSVAAECVCILRSVGVPGGAPLVGEGVRQSRDLSPSARVVSLPETIVVHRSTVVPRVDYVAWSRLLAGLPWSGEPVASLWALSEAVARDGLVEAATRRAVEGREPLEVTAILPWITLLSARAEGRVASASAWRSGRDRSLVASRWIAAAAAQLLDREALGLMLRAPPLDPVTEAFYLRAVIHGHHLAGRLPLADALRDRAVRLLVARTLGPIIAAASPDDPSARYPLALVEAMMRGHGLEAYALDRSPS